MFNAPPAINRKLYQTSGQKLAAFVGIFLLAPVGLLSCIVGLGVIVFILGIENVDINLGASLAAIAVCAACVFGLIKLVPAFQRPVDFAPRFSVPPAALGQPFDVRLQRKSMGAAFSGKGVVQFFPDHMIIDGLRETIGSIQIGILLGVTLVPLALFGYGLGFLPALILAKYIGRKKIVQPIPYQAIRGITLGGNTVTIVSPGLSPAKSVFYVASVDGPRLQGEVQPRFAAMIPSSQF